MNLVAFPKAYQSAFRDACFEFDAPDAPFGVDFTVTSPSQAGPLGVKRFYGAGRVSVNVAPYVRRFLSPRPLCDGAARLHVDAGRTVGCRVSSGDYTTAQIWLTAGVDDPSVNRILTALPVPRKICPGQRDEISAIAGTGNMKPVITFSHNGREYTDTSFSSLTDNRMVTFVVDPDYAGRRFAALTGAAAAEMTGFTVWLTISSGRLDANLSQRYEIDRHAGSGRRLTWVNRYGAVDYYTFPSVAGGRIAGSRERIYTPGGYRTVATSTEVSETLLSAQCDTDTVKWLSEIFSSPSVWTVDGSEFGRVEVAEGAAEYSTSHPGVVPVTVRPSRKVFSRRS